MDNNVSLSRFQAAGIPTVAALPWLLLMLILLSDVQKWAVELSHGLAVLVVPAGGVALLVFGIAEARFRGKHLAGAQQLTWFTPIVAIGLLTFFFVGEWAKPIVMRNPQWCRVYQGIEWTVSDDESFALMLWGRGNAAEHEFRSAYLNWSGDEPAGISSIELRPIRFKSVDATLDKLRKRLAESGLPGERLDSLAPAIWDVLQQANDGKPISASAATVDPVQDQPRGDEHVVLGGVIWMLALVSAFLIVGQLTLVKPLCKDAV